MAADTVAYMPRHMADVLRSAIRESGMSALALSAATGVSQPTITEFLRGKDIRLNTAQKLVDYLGLRLAEANRPKAKRGRR